MKMMTSLLESMWHWSRIEIESMDTSDKNLLKNILARITRPRQKRPELQSNTSVVTVYRIRAIDQILQTEMLCSVCRVISTKQWTTITNKITIQSRKMCNTQRLNQISGGCPSTTKLHYVRSIELSWREASRMLMIVKSVWSSSKVLDRESLLTKKWSSVLLDPRFLRIVRPLPPWEGLISGKIVLGTLWSALVQTSTVTHPRKINQRKTRWVEPCLRKSSRCTRKSSFKKSRVDTPKHKRSNSKMPSTWLELAVKWAKTVKWFGKIVKRAANHNTTGVW